MLEGRNKKREGYGQSTEGKQKEERKGKMEEIKRN